MIINRDFAVSLEAKCNQLVCCECGKNHSVRLEVPGDVVVPCFADTNTCLGFKEQVNNLIRTEVMRRMTDPFPWLR